MKTSDFNEHKFTITKNGYVRINDNTISLEEPLIKHHLITNNALMLYGDAYKLYEQIPSYITKLALSFPSYKRININNLPSGLKELYILYEDDDDWKWFNKYIDNLPPNLEVLCIESKLFNKSLDYLPSGLKKLSIRSNRFNQLLNNLPSSLEEFDLMSHTYSSKLPKIDLTNLPANLKRFYYNYSDSDNNGNKQIEILKTMYPTLKLGYTL